MIERAGGRWRLLSFPVELDVIRQRLKERNCRSDSNALTIDERMLEEFLTRWQPPRDEGEEVIDQGSESRMLGERGGDVHQADRAPLSDVGGA